MCSLQRTVFMALLLALVAMPVRGDVITISVADGNGADAFVDSSVPDAPQGVDNEFRMRVRSDNTQRKTYLRFDLSALAFSNIDSVTMSVFADEDDDVFPNFVHAFGINDGEFGDGLSDWAEDEITFDDAPEVGEIGTEVGENTTMLSSFELPEPPGGGRVPFSGGDEFEFESTPEFVEFIRADKNDLVTFILIYEESVGSSFAIESKEDGAFSPATLTISGSGVAGPALQPGDADQDLDFDQLDLVQVQIAAKYLTGQPATWGEGDWNGAPGGEVGSPPPGNSLFDQLDIIAALGAGTYLTGPYAAIEPNGQRGDGQTSIVYNAMSGEVSVDTTANAELTSINVDSAAGIFTGLPAPNLGGSFDNDADGNIFKATFGGSFGSLSFGNVAQAGLSEQFVLGDLTIVGSLAGGGDLGAVDLIYVPEPMSALLLTIGVMTALLRPRPANSGTA